MCIRDSSSADTLGYGVKQTSMKKPFEFIYKHSIHDEDSQIVGTLVIVIYKARCTSGFSIDPKHLTPMAPKFEAKMCIRDRGLRWKRSTSI